MYQTSDRRDHYARIRRQKVAQLVERHGAYLAVAPNYEQLLAWRGVPSRWVVVHSAIAHVEALDEAKA